MSKKKMTLRQKFEAARPEQSVVQRYQTRLKDLDERTSQSLDKLLFTGEHLLDQAAALKKTDATPVAVKEETSTVTHINRARALADKLASCRVK